MVCSTKRRRWPRLLLWWPLVALLLSCSREKPLVRTAFDPAWRPLILQGLEPNVTGFCLDVLSSIASTEGLAVEALRTTSQNVLYHVESGAYSIGITTVTPTPRLREIFLFSDPLVFTGTSLVVATHGTFQDTSKTKGMVLGVQQASIAFNVVSLLPGTTFKQYVSALDALEDLSVGHLDGVAMDRLPAVTYCRNAYRNRLKVLSPPLDEAPAIRFVAKKDSQYFDKMMDGLKAAPLESLRVKWGLAN